MLLRAATAGLFVCCVNPVLAESREEWQQPNRVMADLALKPGDAVADVGCGEGYFTFRLAEAVGGKGKVFAVDVSAAALKAVRERAEQEKRSNIEVIQSDSTDTKLAKESVGAALLCDVIHEVPDADRGGLMKSIVASLKPGGFLYLIDYRQSRDVTFDPYERLIPHDGLVKYGTDAGLVLDAEFHYLKYQVFLRFRKPPTKEAAAPGRTSPEAFDTHDGYAMGQVREASTTPLANVNPRFGSTRGMVQGDTGGAVGIAVCGRGLAVSMAIPRNAQDELVDAGAVHACTAQPARLARKPCPAKRCILS